MDLNLASDAGPAILADEAERWVCNAAAALVADGRGEWVWDPEVPNVLGLVKPGTRTAWIVVYVEDRDFELSNEFEALV